jgi:phosphate transport system protein
MLRAKMIALKEKIIYESSLVEKMLNLTIEGLLESDNEKLDHAFEYENMINQLEMEIEEMCISMIALYHPEAKDLRTIISILKINSDFERMGDYGTNIIASSKYIIERPSLKPLVTIPNMARETIGMLRKALDAYVKEDVQQAKEICVFDDVIDAYRNDIARDLVTYMISDPKNIERSLELMNISQNLERIADLCTNIAENTVFIKEGKVIKHHNT